MAAMTTALKGFSGGNNGNSKTSTLADHTVFKPQLVIERRKVAEAGTQVAEYAVKAVIATQDAASVVLPQKVSFEVIVRYPVLGSNTDVTSALAVIRDIVAGDEFANSVATQEWLK